MATERADSFSFSRATLRTLAIAGILAVTIPLARVAFVHKPYLFGQGYQYYQLAEALASGQGFKEIEGPRRGSPTVLRPPLWPLILSLPMRACPQCNYVNVVRSTEVAMHAITAFGVALLVGLLSGSRVRMLLATFMIALLPDAQPFLLGGYCEPCSTALLVIGTLLISCGERFFFAGIAVFSLLPLVRPNYLLLWPGVIALVWWLQYRRKSHPVFGTWRRLVAAGILFYIPTALWVVRNYRVSGVFPVVAGTSSLTFYANYNSEVGTLGPSFGICKIPMSSVKVTEKLSELATLRYYDRQGKEFIAQHWKLVPLLLATHIVRTILPAPQDGAHRYTFWLFRLLLYAAVLIAVRRHSITLNSWLVVLLACSVVVTAVTVVLYSGDVRYLYPLNILLVAALCSAHRDSYGKTQNPEHAEDHATVYATTN